MPSAPTTTRGPRTCSTLTDHDDGGPEWLLTDGTGGYATGTVSGLRTRRYHGLLAVPQTNSSSDPTATGIGRRNLALVALDPVVTMPSGTDVELAVHQWASGATAPNGHELLERFELRDGLPRWRWRIGDVVIEREIAMQHGANAVVVVHRVRSAPAALTIRLKALCTWRDADAERTCAGPPPQTRQVADGVVVADAYRMAGPGWIAAGSWYTGALTRAEIQRACQCVEDLWHAGTFTAAVSPGGQIEVCAWSGDLGRRPPPACVVIADARRRNAGLLAAADPPDRTSARLAVAADAFVVQPRRATAATVVAGYPWLGSDDVEALSCYEGLFLTTGKAEIGRSMLAEACARAESLTDVEAGLWLVNAVERHVRSTGDTDLASQAMEPIDRLLAGMASNGDPRSTTCRVDPTDGLLAVGPLGTTAHRMFQRIGGPWASAPLAGAPWASAPSEELPLEQATGKPVEINALWINALGAAAGLREYCGRPTTDLRARQRSAKVGFQRFGSGQRWLSDVVDAPGGTYPLGGADRHDDTALRPHQLLAHSLPYGPRRGRAIPQPVLAGLLTPMGPRSLAATETGYRGSHRGDQYSRDLAYHQGTVWPWMIGAYVDAAAAAGGADPDVLTGLIGHLDEDGLGSVSQSAEGDPPHRATGCPFHARSVAELNRAYRTAYHR